MYDIIGDIHGYADHLEQLLTKLGYENKSGHYSHPERKVIFVGDFIDRGPKIRETLSIVKAMTDENSALAVMGNHEFNALCYFARKQDGDYVRAHSEKNYGQMIETMKQFENSKDDLKYYLNWFRTLPVYLDLGDLRVIHACWDNEHVRYIEDNKNKIDFSEEFLSELFSNRQSEMLRALDVSLKGKEDKIPNGFYFTDKDKTKRYTNRAKWWLDPLLHKYNDYYFEEVTELNGAQVDAHQIKSKTYYGVDDVPVFCGHYWMNHNEPRVQTRNVACVDYSIAKGNILSAYRWTGERELRNENFVWVGL